jgi:transcription elongation GreA/GreB family factor
MGGEKMRKKIFEKPIISKENSPDSLMDKIVIADYKQKKNAEEIYSRENMERQNAIAREKEKQKLLLNFLDTSSKNSRVVRLGDTVKLLFVMVDEKDNLLVSPNDLGSTPFEIPVKKNESFSKVILGKKEGSVLRVHLSKMQDKKANMKAISDAKKVVREQGMTQEETNLILNYNEQAWESILRSNIYYKIKILSVKKGKKK